MIINLSREEFNYLCSKQLMPDNWLRQLHGNSCAWGNSYIFNISEDEAETIRDICIEKLQQSGFDEDYNLTEEGHIIENLIDKFFA